MNNILITVEYKKNPGYGIFIDEGDIIVKLYPNLEEKKLYEDNRKLFLPKNINSEYVYLLEVYCTPINYGSLIKECNICIAYFNTEEEAIKKGIKLIRSSIYKDNIILGGIDDDILEEDIDVLEYEDFTNYTFNIYKILVNRHSFINDRYDYYKENFHNIKREGLYNFILDLLGGYQINHYTIDGKLYDISIIDDYRNYKSASLKSLLGYHVDKFNIGDIVRLKNPHYKNDNFIILHKYLQDHSIYEDKDPLHFREGYQLAYYNDNYIQGKDVDILNEYWEDLIYDEDLIMIKNKDDE